MTERVVIEGAGLAVTIDDAPDPKRKRPPTYRAPAPTGRDLLATISALTRHNPYWTDEANRAAETNPDGLTPKQLARIWAGHRIDPEEVA